MFQLDGWVGGGGGGGGGNGIHYGASSECSSWMGGGDWYTLWGQLRVFQLDGWVGGGGGGMVYIMGPVQSVPAGWVGGWGGGGGGGGGNGIHYGASSECSSWGGSGGGGGGEWYTLWGQFRVFQLDGWGGLVYIMGPVQSVPAGWGVHGYILGPVQHTELK